MELAAELTPSPVVGKVLRDAGAVIRHLEQHFSGSTAPLVIKAGYGTSGRNMQRVRSPGLVPKQRQWVENLLSAQPEVVVEPWLDRLLDLSVQLNVANGKRVVLGVTRFLTDARGQYIGHRLGRKFVDLEPGLRRALYEGGMLAELEETGRRVAQKLEAAGYCGPAGIDALVYREQDAIKLKPLVEINPRYTMGRIAWELDHFIDHAVDAAWLHLNSRQVEAMGFADFSAFVKAGQERFPVRRKAGDGRLLAEGFVPTNDPALAKLLQTVLLIGPALQMAPKGEA